jgi:murein DD-endopeptidase MepM/ murein hydrolase activator NlpD
MALPLRNGFPGALAAALVAAASVPSAAAAAGAGGTDAPAPGTVTTVAPTGGTSPGSAPAASPEPGKPRRRKRVALPPVLVSFHAGARRFYDLGRPARVSFRIDGRSRGVAVKLLVLRDGKRIRTIDLGDRATGRTHSVTLTGREGGRLPEGTLQLRLTARDDRGRGLRASSRASATDSLGFYWHRLPLTGSFTYGGPDARFGAGRTGHVHQGQDLLAPSGSPVVAPRGGVVQTVAYQAGGAGNYIVLKVDGEDRSYVFMHLLDGSTRVREGDSIRTGDRLGDVGATGAASGPHLHFEIWEGAWQDGGTAVDPLPELRRWDAWS